MNTLILLLKEYLIDNSGGVFRVTEKGKDLLELVHIQQHLREIRKRNNLVPDRRFETIWIELRDNQISVLGMWTPLPSREYCLADPQLFKNILDGIQEHFETMDAFLRSQDIK